MMARSNILVSPSLVIPAQAGSQKKMEAKASLIFCYLLVVYCSLIPL